MNKQFKNSTTSLLSLLCCITITFSGCKQDLEGLQDGAVTSASPEATKIGMQILKTGGNAADVAIAVSFALGVSEPAMSGIGGGTQIQMYIPGRKEPFSINGSTLSPAATPLKLNKDSLNNYQRTTIPSTVKVLGYLYEKYGSKNLLWKDLIMPSVELAKTGIEFGTFRKKVFTKYQDKIEKGMPYTSDYYISDDKIKLVLPKLAKAMELIANEGPETFYKGEIAHTIVSDMIDNGGWIIQEDLMGFPDPIEQRSIHFQYNGIDIYTQPEPCGGWVAIEILKNLSQMKHVGIDGLVEAIHEGHALRKKIARQEDSNQNGETTHFSVMDSKGMILSVTASINAYYGSGAGNAEFGFLYNSYMDDFEFDNPKDKYAVGPGKSAYSSMSPTIVLKDGHPFLILGSPGSSRIISTVAQLIHHSTQKEYNPKTLLDLPRVHAANGNVYLETEQLLQEYTNKNNLEIKNPGPEFSMDGLNAYFGGVHAIMWTAEGFITRADPRRDGLALIQ